MASGVEEGQQSTLALWDEGREASGESQEFLAFGGWGGAILAADADVTRGRIESASSPSISGDPLRRGTPQRGICHSNHRANERTPSLAASRGNAPRRLALPAAQLHHSARRGRAVTRTHSTRHDNKRHPLGCVQLHRAVNKPCPRASFSLSATLSGCRHCVIDQDTRPHPHSPSPPVSVRARLSHRLSTFDSVVLRTASPSYITTTSPRLWL